MPGLFSPIECGTRSEWRKQSPVHSSQELVRSALYHKFCNMFCVCVCVTGFGGIIGSDLLPVEQSWQSSNSKRGRGSLVEECVLL